MIVQNDAVADIVEIVADFVDEARMRAVDSVVERTFEKQDD